MNIFFLNVQTYVRHKSTGTGKKKCHPHKPSIKQKLQIWLGSKKSHQKNVIFTKSHKKGLDISAFYYYIVFTSLFVFLFHRGCLLEIPNVQTYVRHKCRGRSF